MLFGGIKGEWQVKVESNKMLQTNIVILKIDSQNKSYSMYSFVSILFSSLNRKI